MLKTKEPVSEDLNPQETSEWMESLDEIIDAAGPDRAAYLLKRLGDRAAEFGVTTTANLNTPYNNTIPRRRRSPVSRVTGKSSGASRTWSGGTLLPWWCAPIRTTTTSAAICPPMRRWRR